LPHGTFSTTRTWLPERGEPPNIPPPEAAVELLKVMSRSGKPSTLKSPGRSGRGMKGFEGGWRRSPSSGDMVNMDDIGMDEKYCDVDTEYQSQFRVTRFLLTSSDGSKLNSNPSSARHSPPQPLQVRSPCIVSSTRYVGPSPRQTGTCLLYAILMLHSKPMLPEVEWRGQAEKTMSIVPSRSELAQLFVRGSGEKPTHVGERQRSATIR